MTYPLQDKYINLLTDFGFKRVFGTEPNKQLLIDFLNTLLPEHHHIKDVTYKSNENLGNTPIDRKAIFDEHKEEKTLLHTVQLKDQDCHLFYDKLQFIYIELPKFIKKLNQLQSHLDKWLFVLKHLSELSERPNPLQEDIFNQLFDVAEIANFSAMEQDSYQNSLKYYRDLNNVVDTSRQEGLEEGRKQGIQEGLIEGRKEGLIEGRKEGLTEGRKEGLTEGLSQGQRALLLRQLSRQLGELPDTVKTLVNQISLEKLEFLSEELFEFQSVDDLITWLNQNLNQGE